MRPRAAARYHLSRDVEFTLRNFRPTRLELLYTLPNLSNARKVLSILLKKKTLECRVYYLYSER
jgi:hypothetical protein